MGATQPSMTAQILSKIEKLEQILAEAVSRRELDKTVQTIMSAQSDLLARIVALETWRHESTQWANDQHTALKQEFLSETKAMREAVEKLKEDNFRWQIAVLMMLLASIAIPLLLRFL